MRGDWKSKGLVFLKCRVLTSKKIVRILASKGLIGLLAPLTLVFYGLALFNTGNFTFREVRVLGIIQIGLGLTGSVFVGYGVLVWAFGFGLMHIVYGICIYLKYER